MMPPRVTSPPSGGGGSGLATLLVLAFFGTSLYLGYRYAPAVGRRLRPLGHFLVLTVGRDAQHIARRVRQAVHARRFRKELGGL